MIFFEWLTTRIKYKKTFLIAMVGFVLSQHMYALAYAAVGGATHGSDSHAGLILYYASAALNGFCSPTYIVYAYMSICFGKNQMTTQIMWNTVACKFLSRTRAPKLHLYTITR